ncbi:MAG: 1-acyl-sn-glycerol-3-phosphate acyltransferase [Treponema sp.]|nr:1-acyl-sn-glycerol-3-phosphate acyltransferase [Treponema sp.]MCL2237868.1 1-acyl-sn-glycerol-3-phosphate acyltransferase [Treponema sp.]
MLGTLTEVFGDQIKRVIKTSKAPTVINEDNVYQEGDPNVLAILDEMVTHLMLPGSALVGKENLEELFEKAQNGKACLLLVEHYSNLDLSIVSYLARKAGGKGQEISDSLIAIGGIKLNEDSPVVAAFTGAYTKIVIYPSRSIQDLDPEKEKDEIARANSINRAAMKALIRHKYKGKLVLVFPSGTRYRAWEPDTKKGVREIDSYVRSFDYMCFVALNGELLHVQKTDMMNDAVSKDISTATVGSVINCNEFRDKAIAARAHEEDKKQVVADALMAELERMHIAAEAERQKLLK